MLKGRPEPEFVVRTQSRIAELGVQQACCELGATYMLFLGRTTDGFTYSSVNGRYGLIRIGPARSPEFRVLPNPK